MDPAPPGDHGTLVERAAVRGSSLLSLRFLFDVSRRPLVLANRQGETDTVVDNQEWMHVLATYAIANRLALHLDLPVLLGQAPGAHPATGPAAPGPDQASAFGDFRLGARYALLDPDGRPRRGFDLALGANVLFPTGNDAYASDAILRGAASLILDGGVSRFYWAASAGVRARRSAKLGFASPIYSGTDLALTAAAGIFVDRAKTFALGSELALDTTFVGTAPFASNGTVAHLLFGAHYFTADGPFDMGVSLGPDIGKGAGSGEYRVIVLVGVVPERALLPEDRDRDGVPDRIDACVTTPGVSSEDPKKNGCPPDRDGDGVADREDACPDRPGAASRVPSRNGCPPFDADSDGVRDEDDACPLRPGPPPPLGNGCPPAPAPAAADIASEQIVISQQVQFETGSAVLLPESDDILGQVARLLTSHPEIELLEVQGHTDERGSPEYNRRLSQDRAASVVAWLVRHEIAPGRLSARGYGRDHPIADNGTEEGMQKNRRVEFHIQKSAERR